jgi:hypothetical protein
LELTDEDAALADREEDFAADHGDSAEKEVVAEEEYGEPVYLGGRQQRRQTTIITSDTQASDQITFRGRVRPRQITDQSQLSEGKRGPLIKSLDNFGSWRVKKNPVTASSLDES